MSLRTRKGFRRSADILKASREKPLGFGLGVFICNSPSPLERDRSIPMDVVRENAEADFLPV